MKIIRKINFPRALLVIILALPATFAMAASHTVYDTTISMVAVNGGADSTNPGTTCIQITSAVSAVCPSGLVAILNNNKQLIAAALLNKATASKINLYYEDASASNHCPGMAFTPCAVISIQSK